MELFDKLDLPDNQGKPVITIMSGGLDSTVMTYALVKKYGKENVKALSFYYGQKHQVELEKAKITCNKLGITHQLLDISFLGVVSKEVSPLIGDTTLDDKMEWEDHEEEEHPNYVVPNRNMILLSSALAYAEAKKASLIFIGVQFCDLAQFWDCKPEFIDAMNTISSLNKEFNIKIVAPFNRVTKAEEILIGQELGVDFNDTWTCYNGDSGDHLACGKCASCVERLENFKIAGIKDPTAYA